MVKKGDIQPTKEIWIRAEETVPPLHNGFNLNFKGESLRVVVALVSYPLYLLVLVILDLSVMAFSEKHRA